MKSYLWAIIALIVLGGAFVFFTNKSRELIGPDVRLALFNTGATKKGILYIPFLQAAASARADIFLDADGNGEYSDSEKIASDISLKPGANKNIGVPVTVSAVPEKGVKVKIAFENDSYIRPIVEIAEEKVDLMELSKVTDKENAMKGLFGSVAFAQETPATEASRLAPDIGQKIAECAPTAAANSIISLAQEHGGEGQLPTDDDLINSLKGEMDWTPANGVSPADFIAGKNKWAAKHGLPIRTELVGGAKGAGTIEGILDAMASSGGAAAELRMSFVKNGQADGGHMVTVTGVRVEGDQTFIEVSDPRTPEGSESYELEGRTIVGYPYEGTALISYGFVQRWESSATVGADAMTPMTDAEVRGIQQAVGEKEKIQVIMVNGHQVPLSQVHIGKGEHCDSKEVQWPHYHATTNGSVKALDGTVIPDTQECGYGKAKDVPVVEVELP
jgi:hypothetical protein